MSMLSSFSAVSAQGRFSNGQTAASVPVEVRLDGQGIAIREFSGHPTSPVVWSYGGLHAGVSLSKETDEVLLSSGSMPGATLFVADRGFVAALAAAAPHLKTSAERWRIAKPLVMLAVALVTAVGVARYLGFSPVNVAAALMPDSMRTALGGRVLTSLTRGLRPCNGAAGRAALDKLTERLTAAGAASTKFHVFVFDWDLVNAFAVPGEQIILTRALIETAHSVDEVAGVLAHEMGHGLERHGEKRLVRAVGLAALMEFILAGSSGTLSNFGLTLLHLRYSRAAEREADQHALRLLKAAGIPVQGFADFMMRSDKMKEAESSGRPRRGIGIMDSHPHPAERARLASLQPAYAATPALSEADWNALRTICTDG